MLRHALLRSCAVLGAAGLAVWGGSALAAAPEITKMLPSGLVSITPESSFPSADSRLAHTNVHIVVTDRLHRNSSTPIVGFETPASLACVYGLVAPTSGCNPTTATAVPTGGSKLVILVDAFDDPTAQNDLTVFSKQYGLPPITKDNFEVVYATGTKPPQDSSGGWEFEESLDIEMAHAMAPGAKVILMEAASNNNSDLTTAVKAAAKLAAAAGGGEISMSYGGGESANEGSSEGTYTGKNVVFVASTGDSPGVEAPSVLDNVIGVGGTNIVRDTKHNFQSQTAWTDTGGGISKYLSIPDFQSAIPKVKKIVGKFRGVPDVSMNGGPSTAVSIYDTTPYNGSVLNWSGAYGTSESSPLFAGVLNAAGKFSASSEAEHKLIYDGYTAKANWTDIVSGTCGNNGGSMAVKNYDLCTGVGVPNGYGRK